MTIRAAAVALALLASVAPALVRGVEEMHSPHPQHSSSISVERTLAARRAEPDIRRG